MSVRHVVVAVQDPDNQKQHQSLRSYNENIMGQIFLPEKHEKTSQKHHGQNASETSYIAHT